MSEHSNRFNALPDSAREIACNLMLEYEVRGLNLELDRLKRRYMTSRKEITEKIKYMERELKKLETNFSTGRG